MDERADLEGAIEAAHKRLITLLRGALLEADPADRARLLEQGEGLQREIFHLRKRLDALRTGPTLQELEPSPGPAAGRPVLYISSSHKDRRWRDRLMAHLTPLVAGDRIELWDDTRTEPGAPWRERLERSINAARVAIPLVSVDYLASDPIDEEVIPLLSERGRRGDLRILPVIVGPCRFLRTPLARFPAVNDPSSPLVGTSRVEQEKVLANVARLAARSLEEPPVLAGPDRGAR